VLPSGVAVTRAPFARITLDGTSNVSSPLMDPKSRGKQPASRSNGNSSKENRIVVPSRTSKYISKPTRQTPQQLLKANMESNEMKEVHSRAYGWALDTLNILFNLQKGQSRYVGQGRKPHMTDQHLFAISHGLMGWLTVMQLNGEPEKKNIDMINSTKSLLNNSNKSQACPELLWEKIKVKNTGYLNLSKNQMIE
jgi:hypothetical protein